MSIPISAVSTPDATAPEQLKAAKAAGQFESLLIAQMLKSMREEGSGWLGTGADKSADSAIGFAEEHFASALSAAGGLGLASIVQNGLKAPDAGNDIGTIHDGKGVVGSGLWGNR